MPRLTDVPFPHRSFSVSVDRDDGVENYISALFARPGIESNWHGTEHSPHNHNTFLMAIPFYANTITHSKKKKTAKKSIRLIQYRQRSRRLLIPVSFGNMTLLLCMVTCSFSSTLRRLFMNESEQAKAFVSTRIKSSPKPTCTTQIW